MTAALRNQLDSGHTVLITAAEDSLPWSRSEHNGWGVGLYEPDEDAGNDRVRFDSTADSLVDALVELLRSVLLPNASSWNVRESAKALRHDRCLNGQVLRFS
jgi:hypothetical protein